MWPPQATNTQNPVTKSIESHHGVSKNQVIALFLTPVPSEPAKTASVQAGTALRRHQVPCLMELQDGYYDVPAGKMANVQTCLEMHAPPAPLPCDPNPAWRLIRVERPTPERYRALFHSVGDDCLWSSRLTLGDAALLAVLHDPRVELYVLDVDGGDEGILELDFREKETCELKFFGVTRSVQGRGAGRWLINHATRLAWSKQIRRFWVHTCTLDHPRALPLYIGAGFTPFLRQIEIMDDPRAIGIVRRNAAPDVPIL